MSGDGGWHRTRGRDTEDPERGDGRGRHGSTPVGNGYQGRYQDGGSWPQDGYEQSGRHGGPAGYGSAGYGGQDEYGRPDYDTSGGYGDHPGAGHYDQQDGYGDQAGYGPGGGSNGRSYGQDPYRPYTDSSYQGNGYGQGSYRHDEPYRDDRSGPPGYQPDTGQGWEQISRRDTDPYGDQSGSYGTTGPAPHDPIGTGSYPAPGGDRYDRGGYAQARSYEPDDSGIYDWADSGSFELDEQPQPHDRGDRRYDSSESGTFWGPKTGPPGREPMPAGRGPLPDGGEAYASWHDEPDEKPLWEPQDDNVWDDDESSMLSRRFGRGREPDDGGDHDDRGRRGGSAARRKARAKRQKRGRGRAASTLALLIVFGLIGGAGFFGYQLVHNWIVHRYGNYSGQGTGHVKITVPAGASLVGLGPTLLKDNVIMALRPYDSAAGAATNASSLQPGTYVLHYHMKASLAVKLLLSGKTRTTNTFTALPDGRAADIASNLANKTNLPLSQFTQIIDHPTAALGLPAWAAGHSAEGFLFPDTYTLAPNMTPLQLLQMMVKDFNRRTASLNLPAAAHKVYTTPFHVLIVASLIQAEGNATDFPSVSRVIWNRLKNGMPLQLDSTVFYAMHKFGTAITQADEKFPSPYNTYLHTGLPPGPIGSPDLAAIQAALHPNDSPAARNWLYFITNVNSPTHKTYFTSSLTQFHKWQRQFQG